MFVKYDVTNFRSNQILILFNVLRTYLTNCCVKPFKFKYFIVKFVKLFYLHKKASNTSINIYFLIPKSQTKMLLVGQEKSFFLSL